jgi:phosphatidylserine synthase
MRERPATLIVAAAVQGAESLGVLAATVIVCADTISGQSYQVSSGIALTLIGFAATAALAVVAFGLAHARRWSRTPALLTQLFSGIVAIYLIEGHRYGWGVPLLLLAVAGLAALLAPPTFRALTGGPAAPPH